MERKQMKKIWIAATLMATLIGFIVSLQSCNTTTQLSLQEKLVNELSKNALQNIGNSENYRLIGINFIDTLDYNQSIYYKIIHEYYIDGKMLKNLKISEEIWITEQSDIVRDKEKILYFDYNLLVKKYNEEIKANNLKDSLYNF